MVRSLRTTVHLLGTQSVRVLVLESERAQTAGLIIIEYAITYKTIVLVVMFFLCAVLTTVRALFCLDWGWGGQETLSQKEEIKEKQGYKRWFVTQKGKINNQYKPNHAELPMVNRSTTVT